MIPKELDDTDRKIINELKKNSRISMTELGKKVFMTGQAAKNRLERLQDLGVVERYTVNVNCPVFGYTVHGLFILRLEKDRAADFYRFVHTTNSTFCTATKQKQARSSLMPISRAKKKGTPSFRSSRPTVPAACTGW